MKLFLFLIYSTSPLAFSYTESFRDFDSENRQHPFHQDETFGFCNQIDEEGTFFDPYREHNEEESSSDNMDTLFEQDKDTIAHSDQHVLSKPDALLNHYHPVHGRRRLHPGNRGSRFYPRGPRSPHWGPYSSPHSQRRHGRHTLWPKWMYYNNRNIYPHGPRRRGYVPHPPHRSRGFYCPYPYPRR